MSTWKTRLREADSQPGAPMAAADVARIRATVVAAARERAIEHHPGWARPLAFIAAMLLVVVAGVTASWQVGLRKAKAIATEAPPAVAPGGSDVQAEPPVEIERQQLHFATPGGTRIIWVFDSQFDIKGTLP
jgi:hypothetical protein